MKDNSILNLIGDARELAQRTLHRRDIGGNLSMYGSLLEFVGLSCFNSSMRPSTKRVIDDIRKSGRKVCMLTGDNIQAGFAVAKRASLFDAQQSAILDLHKNKLMWKRQRT